MRDSEKKSYPSDNQVREFWEWCGFARLPEGNRGYHFEQTVKTMNWLPPYETEIYASIPFLPVIDLNNLFKYAVSKVRDCLKDEYLGFSDLMMIWLSAILSNKDPALALFWAIWGAINAK